MVLSYVPYRSLYPSSVCSELLESKLVYQTEACFSRQNDMVGEYLLSADQACGTVAIITTLYNQAAFIHALTTLY